MINGDIFNGIVYGLILFGIVLACVLGGLAWLVWWVLQHLQWVG